MLKPGEIPPPPEMGAEHKVKSQSIANEFAYDTGLPISKDKKANARVSQISNKLLSAAGYPPESIAVRVVQSGDDANAFAVEGSAIIVFDGLLKKVPDDNELAAVLGHEIGHLLGRHSEEASEEERAGDLGMTSSILGTLTSVAMSVGGLGGIGRVAGNAVEDASNTIGYGAYVRAFDRSQEYEADQIGVVLMAKAGYNPEAAISFWKRAKEIFGEGADEKGAFYSTHPGSQERISHLEEVLPIAKGFYVPPAPSAKGSGKGKK
jgi:predicted Zn-dependent protease